MTPPPDHCCCSYSSLQLYPAFKAEALPHDRPQGVLLFSLNADMIDSYTSRRHFHCFLTERISLGMNRSLIPVSRPDDYQHKETEWSKPLENSRSRYRVDRSRELAIGCRQEPFRISMDGSDFVVGLWVYITTGYVFHCFFHRRLLAFFHF